VKTFQVHVKIWDCRFSDNIYFQNENYRFIFTLQMKIIGLFLLWNFLKQNLLPNFNINQAQSPSFLLLLLQNF